MSDIDKLRASEHFDAEWYLTQYPDVAALGMDPAEHYLKYGRMLGRAPNQNGRRPVFLGVASIPDRKALLAKTLESIIDQVDHIFVHLNHYRTVPAFLQNPKISITRSQEFGDLRDTGKFLSLERVPSNSIFFSIDDDIIYPSDYVEKMCETLAHSNYECVVGVHGVVYPRKTQSFFDRISFHFMRELPCDLPVSLLGTGTIAFPAGLIRPKMSHFPTHGMADIHFAKLAKLKGIPLIARSREDNWLFDDEEAKKLAGNLYRETKNDASEHNAQLTASNPWGFADIIERLDQSSGAVAKTLSAEARAFLRHGLWLEKGCLGPPPTAPTSTDTLKIAQIAKMNSLLLGAGKTVLADGGLHE